MANEKNNEGSTGNRYTEDVKKEAVKFLEKEDTERGNVKRAMEKFGCSYIALRSWLKKYGSNTKKAAKASPKKVSGDVVGKRGRKANPSIHFRRALEKMKARMERELEIVNKTLQKIPAE